MCDKSPGRLGSPVPLSAHLSVCSGEFTPAGHEPHALFIPCQSRYRAALEGIVAKRVP